VSARLFVGESRIAPGGGDLLIEGRGLAYGDGVFETMRAVDGAIPWWPRHRERLLRGAARLGLQAPPLAVVERELQDLLGTHAQAVIKLIHGRGHGGRGYAAPPGEPPVWALLASALPPAPRPGGLVLRWCATRLALQPRLAGIKHCNRLEQVLARAEWDDPGIDEGLMLDTEGAVVSATAANLFVYREGRWWTPPVDRCGIAGVCRGWALDALGADERRLARDDVLDADAVVLCNAVRGILPVARLGDRDRAPHPAVAEARSRLADAHPGFAIASQEDVP
jgi:4-amino-4-deoxychorismate lyase